MSQFWTNYARVEKGTLVSLDEFTASAELKEEVKNGIRGMALLILEIGREKLGKYEDWEGLIWELGRAGILSPSLLGEVIDVIRIALDPWKVDDGLLHSMLVRIMEILEEVYFSLGGEKQ